VLLNADDNPCSKAIRRRKIIGVLSPKGCACLGDCWRRSHRKGGVKENLGPAKELLKQVPVVRREQVDAEYADDKDRDAVILNGGRDRG